MSNPALITDRIRLKIAKGLPLVDALTGNTPRFVAGTDVQIELGIFFNSDPVDITKYTSITVDIKDAADSTGLSLVSRTIGSESFVANADMTADEWADGISQHMVLALSRSTDTNIDVQDNQRFWLVVTALSTPDTGGKVMVLADGFLDIENAGLVATAFRPNVGGDIIPSGATYDAGGSYTLSGLTINKVYVWEVGTGTTSITNGTDTMLASAGSPQTFIAHATAVIFTGTMNAEVKDHVRLAEYLTAEQCYSLFDLTTTHASLITSIGLKMPLAGGTFSGDVTLASGKKIVATTDVSGPGDTVNDYALVTKHWVRTNFATGSTLMPLAGGTFTGAVVLAADPVSGSPGLLQPVTRQYFENRALYRNDGAGNAATSSLRTMKGELFLDTTVTSTPTTDAVATSRGYVNAQVTALIGGAPSDANTLAKLLAKINGVLPLSGGGSYQMTGPLVLVSADPTANDHAARKAYVDTFLNKTGGTMTGLIQFSTAGAGLRLNALSSESGLSSLTGGELFWQTANEAAYLYNGAAWRRLVMADPTTGDILSQNGLILAYTSFLYIKNNVGGNVQLLGARNATAVNALTGSLTGTLDGALADCTDTTATDQSTVINKNFANLMSKMNLVLNRLGHTNGHGLITSNA